MNRMGTFFGELRRRKVWLVGGVYIISAWIIAQVASLVLPNFAAPGWVMPVLLIVLGLGLPLAIILAWAQETQAPPAPPSDEESSADDELDPKGIAVLPFENLSPDPDNAYFAAGVHEEVLNQLAKIHDLNVIARTSVLEYAASPKAISTVAKELRVGSVLEGSVRYAGDQVRVTAQLIDGASNVHLWSETYDRNLDDIFGIQSEIALSIADALRATLTTAETEAIERPLTSSPDAFGFYLRAQALANMGGVKLNLQSIELLDRAIELDPEFAAAIARKAAIVTFMSEFFNTEVVENPFQFALQLINRALKLDPRCAAAYWAKGSVLRNFNDWEGSLTAFERAVELAPNEVAFQIGLGVIHSFMGQHEKALVCLERGLRLDPGSSVVHSFASKLYADLGREEEAVREAGTTVTLGGSIVTQRIQVAMVMLEIGRPAEAREHLSSAETLLQSGEPVGRLLLAVVWAMIGETERAMRIAEGMDFENEDDLHRAAWLLHTGDREGALDHLEKRLAETGYLRPSVNVFSPLQPLHREPRYQAMMQKIGLAS